MRKCFPQLRVGAGLNRIGKPAAADWLAMTSLCGMFFSPNRCSRLWATRPFRDADEVVKVGFGPEIITRLGFLWREDTTLFYPKSQCSLRNVQSARDLSASGI
jgi:hypothetical protein